jgi:hypothetical protein
MVVITEAHNLKLGSSILPSASNKGAEMKFITLTTMEHKVSILVNPDHIVAVMPAFNGGSRVSFAAGEGSTIVKESLDEIKKLCKGW